MEVVGGQGQTQGPQVMTELKPLSRPAVGMVELETWYVQDLCRSTKEDNPGTPLGRASTSNQSRNGIHRVAELTLEDTVRVDYSPRACILQGQLLSPSPSVRWPFRKLSELLSLSCESHVYLRLWRRQRLKPGASRLSLPFHFPQS